MQIVVSGLWHLGCVTAACAAEHYDVVGHDPDRGVVAGLDRGEPPIYEPGLTELIDATRREGRLRFSNDERCVADADVVWVTHDTPVDARDEADVEFVARNVESLLPHMRSGALVVVSSQVPAGFIARMEQSAAMTGAEVSFAYCPENLRLGQALDIFRMPDRIVVGVRSGADQQRVAELLAPFSTKILWMSPESAEMTKHALNAFLATSVTFINEIAAICECVGADVKDVERALKSESRIGPRAYLSAGGGFAGGTLARDVRALIALAQVSKSPANVLEGVLATNDLQQKWAERVLTRELGGVRGAQIAVLGLTYKAGTDTLRRSSAVELSRRLHQLGADVFAYDPVVKFLPDDLAEVIALKQELPAALKGADALVVGTEWPQFLEMPSTTLTAMRQRIVVDPKRWLETAFGSDDSVRYFAVGKSTS